MFFPVVSRTEVWQRGSLRVSLRVNSILLTKHTHGVMLCCSIRPANIVSCITRDMNTSNLCETHFCWWSTLKHLHDTHHSFIYHIILMSEVINVVWFRLFYYSVSSRGSVTEGLWCVFERVKSQRTDVINTEPAAKHRSDICLIWCFIDPLESLTLCLFSAFNRMKRVKLSESNGQRYMTRVTVFSCFSIFSSPSRSPHAITVKWGRFLKEYITTSRLW